jgi:2C-methyl-D-erythritol 2,4-cyclodiphosphate synthase
LYHHFSEVEHVPNHTRT